MAESRLLWLLVGAVYAALAVGTAALLLTEPLPTLRAQILTGMLVAAAVAHLATRPPAIGTVRNHAAVASSYLCGGWALFAIQPGGSLAIGGAMFVAPFIAIRLVVRREIAAHLVAANVVFLAVAVSGVAFALVDASTVIAVLLVSAGTTVQCFTCAVMLSAAEQQGTELELLTRSDVLTGIGNRRLFDQRLAERVEAYHADPSPFAVVIVDINDFKSINDRAGHLAGDEVLQIVAARLRAVVREGETLVRLGGDEYCLILDEEPGADADRSAGRVQEALVSIAYNEFLVTAGVGSASWPRDADDPEQLQLVADARLRDDKHRTAVASRPPTTTQTAHPMTQIRRADPTDAPELHRLAAETFPLACPPGASEASIATFIDEMLSVERFEAYLADPARELFIAGDFDGYAMLVHGEPTDPDVAAALTTRPTAQLDKIYVRPGAHGSGIATALVEAALRAAKDRGALAVWLGVNQENGRANAFYEKSGFRQVGLKHFMVGDERHDDFTRELVFPPA